MLEDGDEVEREIKHIERKVAELRTLIDQAEEKLAALRRKSGKPTKHW